MIVAELSASHNQSLEHAMALVRAAADAGADGIKLQTWTPDTIAVDRVIQGGPWAGKSMVDLYRQAHTPWEWHKPLFDYAKSLGIEAFSSVFDLDALDFLEAIGCTRYKIASFEVTDLELITHASETGKPVVISTGMATLDEIWSAVRACRTAPTLLKCVSAYPADASDANLATMLDMRRFGCDVGLSDHTIGSTAAVAATVLGAVMVEKHLTLRRADGLDDGFASEPHEFAHMVNECRAARATLGHVTYGPIEAELPSLRLRRSLWLAKDVAAGRPITRDDLRIARPADGMSPSALSRILGKHFTRDAARDTPLTPDLIGA